MKKATEHQLAQQELNKAINALYSNGFDLKQGSKIKKSKEKKERAIDLVIKENLKR